MTALFLLGVLARAGGWSSGTEAGSPVDDQTGMDVFALLFGAWNVAPLVAAVGIVLWTPRWWPRGLGALAVGSVALAVLTAVSLQDFWTSDSSTAALIFLVLPCLLWLGLGAAVGVAALLQEVLTGREASRTGASWRGPEEKTR